MKRQLKPPHVAFLGAGDLALTRVALLLANLGRHHLPIGAPISTDTVYLTPTVWALVAIVWLAVFYLWGA